MKNTYRIGDGNVTSTSQAPSYYFSYEELGLPMNEEIFNEERRKFLIFYESDEITPIRFRVKSSKVQRTSQYYFVKVEIKIPRNPK